MKPPQPNNRVDSRNLNFGCRSGQGGSRDGVHTSVNSVNLKKKSGPSYVGIDDKKVIGIRENAGIANPLFEKGGRRSVVMEDGRLVS
ncbi:hypothetical protein AgCh_024819 [Apium graveolens]